eukprot:TRINITY_DN30921_c0_g1_i1.p1 TRINITY_DN30921_c0_g1~~TRINITY_DN30921_c0_g1_i1.p1  ORF type:complete len:430 (-),score=104.72 TRINITY_DN30921_c0_g1_i1:101-1390(-)
MFGGGGFGGGGFGGAGFGGGGFGGGGGGFGGSGGGAGAFGQSAFGAGAADGGFGAPAQSQGLGGFLGNGGGGGQGLPGGDAGAGGAAAGRPAPKGDQRSLMPVTLRMVLEACTNLNQGQDTPIVVNSQELSLFTFCACIESVKLEQAFRSYVVNDSTGRIAVKLYTDADLSGQAASLQAGEWVRVFGTLRHWGGDLHVSAHSIGRLEHPNELPYHFIEVAHVHLTLTGRMPTKAAMAARASSAAPAGAASMARGQATMGGQPMHPAATTMPAAAPLAFGAAPAVAAPAAGGGFGGFGGLVPAAASSAPAHAPASHLSHGGLGGAAPAVAGGAQRLPEAAPAAHFAALDDLVGGPPPAAAQYGGGAPAVGQYGALQPPAGGHYGTAPGTNAVQNVATAMQYGGVQAAPAAAPAPVAQAPVGRPLSINPYS